MHRALYLIGTGYLAICAVIVLRYRTNTVPHVQTAQFDGPASEWFVSMKPFCNAVEVELAQRQHPAPTTLEGRGFSAACFALGGKIEAARRVIDRLPPGERHRAAGIVFEVAHPVADAGDNRSAGPIMELVIEYWPNHYMALYHAGMSEFALGQSELARLNLKAFLSYYDENDGWTRSARKTLDRLAGAR
ncbi:MAG: tetratricopeptide repeat protein [Gemmatimonadales bacterium]